MVSAATLGEHHIGEEAEPEAILFKENGNVTLICEILPVQRPHQEDF